MKFNTNPPHVYRHCNFKGAAYYQSTIISNKEESRKEEIKRSWLFFKTKTITITRREKEEDKEEYYIIIQDHTDGEYKFVYNDEKTMLQDFEEVCKIINQNSSKPYMF